MKQIIFFLLSIFLIFFNNSCSDSCKDVNCNNGICVDGNCSCDFGWTGDICDTKISSKFLGDWDGNLDCANDTTVTFHISDIPNELQKIGMHSVGLNFNIQGFTFNFDNYKFTGNIDSTFTSFDIDTLPISVTIPNLGQKVDANITGNGIFLQDSSLNINLDIIATSPFPYTIKCSGNFKK